MNTEQSNSNQLIQSGLPNAYEYALERLCKDNLPQTKYFEFCSQYILDYELLFLLFKSKPISVNLKPNNELIIDLKISPHDCLCPIILKKDNPVVFKVNGKVSFFKNSIEINSDSKESYNFFPIGELLGRNSSTPEEGYFRIENGMKYNPKKTGALFVCFNYDQYSKVKGEGKLSLVISQTGLVNDDVIYKTLGFDSNYKEENMILRYINMARKSPNVFAQVYLSHLTCTNSIIATLYKEMLHMNKLPSLDCNLFLTQLSSQHSKDLGKSGRVSHYNANRQNQIQRAKSLKKGNAINVSFCDIIEAYCVIQSPIDYCYIVLKLLIDELVPSFENRKCLLNDKIRFCGISISPHKSYDNICVINFSENEY